MVAITSGSAVRKSLGIFWTFVLWFSLVPGAGAHDFWVDQRGKEFLVIYGHGEHREEFDPSSVRVVKAFDAAGTEVEVRRVGKEKGLLLQPATLPSWIYVAIDHGYWSKTIYGWKNLPKRKASRVVEAIRSFYSSKAVVSWSAPLARPFPDAPLDIALLQSPLGMKAGDPFIIKVFFRGKPAPGLEIEGLDHETVATTDREGVARVRMAKGRQLISASHKEPLKDDPDADFLSCTATLTFEVGK